jgi:hypothetical protein
VCVCVCVCQRENGGGVGWGGLYQSAVCAPKVEVACLVIMKVSKISSNWPGKKGWG